MCKCKNGLPITRDNEALIPWTSEDIYYSYAQGRNPHIIDIIDNNGIQIISGIDKNKGNYIIQAVNAYDKNQEIIGELVEALKEVTDRYERLEILYAKTANINYDCENGSIKRAKQALTKAGRSC